MPRTTGWPALVKLFRPHQWVKNVLVIAPLLLSHQLHADKVLSVLFAFVAFCLCASAVYVLNDALDVHDDRTHPKKRTRPFAAGSLHLLQAPIIATMLLAVAACICIRLPSQFGFTLFAYFVASTAYSTWLKTRLLVDVIVLAGLYTLRIIAGGAAASVEVSPWLMAFSIFLFLSLAFAKRYVELARLPERDPNRFSVRGYHVEDLRLVEVVGPCMGCIAALVLALYVNSEIVTRLYHRPLLLWLLSPILLYWITRVWFFARRGALHEDPVLFAIRDHVTWLVVGAIAVVLVLATF